MQKEARMDFIGREVELKTLENLYNSDKFECVIIYGRKKVGKSELIRNFIQNKRAIFYLGNESLAESELTDFNQTLANFEAQFKLPSESWPSFNAALSHIFNLAKNERLILVLDEYPYMTQSVKGLSSILQNLIDEFGKNSKLMIILCSSSISMMEEETLAYKAPLFGRTTCRINLQPLEFKEILKFFPNFTHEEIALTYGILGGMPYYLKMSANEESFKDNLINLFLKPDGRLTDAPFSILNLELSEPKRYDEIFKAMASGASRLNEIATYIHAETSNTSYFLNKLIKLRLVYKQTPYLEDNSKKTIYGIEDHLLRFWYSMIEPNLIAINQGSGHLRYQQILSRMSDFMGFVFERICTQYLWHLQRNERLPVICGSMGRWWGKSKEEHSQVEIDLMGEEDKHKALFADCKWQNEPTSLKVLNKLQQRSALFNYDESYYYLFAKSGFTPECYKVASPYIQLISFDELCQDLILH